MRSSAGSAPLPASTTPNWLTPPAGFGKGSSRPSTRRSPARSTRSRSSANSSPTQASCRCSDSRRGFAASGGGGPTGRTISLRRRSATDPWTWQSPASRPDPRSSGRARSTRRLASPPTRSRAPRWLPSTRWARPFRCAAARSARTSPWALRPAGSAARSAAGRPRQCRCTSRSASGPTIGRVTSMI